MSKIALGAVAAAVFAAACARAPDPPASAQAQQPPPSSSLPTQPQLDRFLAEGPDTTLRKLSVTDYWLHYKLMQATGIGPHGLYRLGPGRSGGEGLAGGRAGGV